MLLWIILRSPRRRSFTRSSPSTVWCARARWRTRRGAASTSSSSGAPTRAQSGGSVKGHAAHERGVLEEVTELRGAARALRTATCGPRPGRRRAVGGARQAVAVAENYPDLKASGNFLDLQQRLGDLENELQMARRYYNGAVRNLNALVQSFPSNLIAGMFGFAARYFELSDTADRAAPQVALSRQRDDALALCATSAAARRAAVACGSRPRVRGGGHPIFRFERPGRQGRRAHRHRNPARAGGGRAIRHGIYRDFPLTFKDAGGTCVR